MPLVSFLGGSLSFYHPYSEQIRKASCFLSEGMPFPLTVVLCISPIILSDSFAFYRRTKRDAEFLRVLEFELFGKNTK